MSINVSVPLDALANPGVARALSDLMLSLGGVSPSQEVTPRPEAQPPRATRPAPARPAPRRRASSRRRSRSQPAADSRTEEERYRDFVENLPDPSRQFLDLIHKHGNLRLSQAVRELGITRPKTLGGITGSLTRWAKQRGVDLPYKAGKTSDGERIWTWTRGSDGSATGKRSRSRRRGAGSKASGRSAKSKESDSASSNPEPKIDDRPDVTGAAILEDDRYAALIAGMSDTARRFLVALSERGSLTMTEALTALERKRAKTVGDVVRSYFFRTRDEGLKLPFEEGATKTGERMWVWTGVVDQAQEDPKERPDPRGVILIRGGRDRNARTAS